MTRTVTLRGPFSDEDLAVLTTALRLIDNHNPEATFEIVVVDLDGTIEEGQSLLDKMLPEVAGRVTGNRGVVERFSDAHRQLIVTLLLKSWVRLRGDPDLADAEEELRSIVARMGGTDTVLFASRAYPSKQRVEEEEEEE